MVPVILQSNVSMELIIKPTEKCNFKCTFCSSSSISDEPTQTLDLDYIFTFLRKYPNTNTIIVNGGDPLMVKPEYYWKIINFLNEHSMKTTLSFTTNLWAFKVRPDLWATLLKHNRVGVTTSFNYGNTRLKGDKSVYSVDDFWEVSNMMLEIVGYRPDFISVITTDNEHTAISNVMLAKEMDVECKLNYAMASGSQSEPYQLSKIYDLYIQIYETGLSPWEYNTKQLIRRLSTGNTTCPQNTQCDSNIRAMNPGGDYYSCAAFGDDGKYPINFNQEMVGNVATPLQTEAELASLKTECFTCDMFKICNGCKKTISDMNQQNIVEQHCELMKTLAPTIVDINRKESCLQ